MGARRQQNSERERETQSAYRLSVHLLLLPSLSEHFFLTGYNRCSPPIYHSEELNVDTSKYFHTHGPLGACVFSLFKMERPDPSLAVCDGSRNCEGYLYACAFMRGRAMYLSAHAPWMTPLKISPKRARFQRARDARATLILCTNDRDQDKCCFS